MSFFENVFSPSKEYIHFNIKTLDSYENIKLVFLIQSNVNNIDNNTNKKIFPLKKINNLYYELTIEKQELFKYDELQFLITNENKKYYSKVMDFYANIDQTWTISLNNNGVLCKPQRVFDDGISSELMKENLNSYIMVEKTINLPLDQDIDTKAINDRFSLMINIKK